MDYLPVFFRIEQQACLVVGGGHIAKRKVSILLKAKAKSNSHCTRCFA
jgi:uroporphyrin-III C-methyltransferase/precorrin-2 dehydrogenase/sirohydrochlorin ferrochelatase